MPARNDDQQCGRGCVHLNGIGRLADGVSAKAQQQEMTSIAAVLEHDYPDDFDTTVMVQTLSGSDGRQRSARPDRSARRGGDGPPDCVRQRRQPCSFAVHPVSEIAVRTARAPAAAALSHLLTENLVLAFAEARSASSSGGASMPQGAGMNLPRLDDVRFDVPTFAFARVVFATTMLLGRSQLARSASQVLGQRGAVGMGGRAGRGPVLVAEVGLSWCCSRAGLLRSLVALQDTHGFHPEGLTVFTLPASGTPSPAQVVATFEQLDAVPCAAGRRRSRVSPVCLSARARPSTVSRARIDRRRLPDRGGSLYHVVDAGYSRR